MSCQHTWKEISTFKYAMRVHLMQILAGFFAKTTWQHIYNPKSLIIARCSRCVHIFVAPGKHLVNHENETRRKDSLNVHNSVIGTTYGVVVTEGSRLS